MNLLPWLLDWPPGRGAVGLFLLVTVASAGTIALFGPAYGPPTDASLDVDAGDVTVKLNDEFEYPETNGTVESCMSSGTPGDSISVIGDVTVSVPVDRKPELTDQRLDVVVSLAHTEASYTTTVEGEGTAEASVFWLLEDDETLSVGENATLTVRVLRPDGTELANASEPVPVEEGELRLDC